MKKKLEYILPIAVFVIMTLLLDTMIRGKTIMEIEWGHYVIFIVVSVITGYLIRKAKQKDELVKGIDTMQTCH